jgi:hypothetical protein
VSLPPLGYSTLFVAPIDDADARSPAHSQGENDDTIASRSGMTYRSSDTNSDSSSDAGGIVTLSNGVLAVSYDASTGRFTNISDVSSGVSTPFTQEWLRYTAFAGTVQNSGMCCGCLLRTGPVSFKHHLYSAKMTSLFAGR